MQRCIQLFRSKVKIYDRAVFYKLYSGVSKGYTNMIKGTPLLLNINGTLVDIKSLSDAVVHRKDLARTEKYVANVLSANMPADIRFKLI